MRCMKSARARFNSAGPVRQQAPVQPAKTKILHYRQIIFRLMMQRCSLSRRRDARPVGARRDGAACRCGALTGMSESAVFSQAFFLFYPLLKSPALNTLLLAGAEYKGSAGRQPERRLRGQDQAGVRRTGVNPSNSIINWDWHYRP